ncbi:MAG: 2-dehydropantoate 2-reductase [Thermomicrobiales bacterium]|nr:2-dehydropantoate 2-reductase [Thermomicrobiales bacterium]MCO5221825.1 2-dehydropantoate 2-reductase [Thermomicrobiales bacterium]
MRILIVGAGALGGLYGALLARAGNEVTVLARGAALDTLRADGLTLESPRYGTFTQPVRAIPDPTDAGPVDLIFIAVKSYDLDAAAQQIVPLVHDGVTVVAVQNGIEHPRKLAAVVGDAALLPGVVIVSATVPRPGTIQHVGGPALLQLGDIGVPNPERLARIAAGFQETGAPVETYSDLWPKLWTKFGFIAAMSGVTALTRLTLRQIFAVPETRRLYHDTIAEVVDVARASGVELPDSTPENMIAMVEGQHPMPERGSMAYDLMAGRRIEISALNGSVVRLGNDLGIATPINRVITAALLPYKDGASALSAWDEKSPL